MASRCAEKVAWGLVPALLAAGCGPGAAGPGGDPVPLLDGLPRGLTPAEVRVVDAANGFTFTLAREAIRGLPPDSSVFLSPLSASFALGMTLNGARGPTLDAMRGALGFGAAPVAEVNQGYRDLMALLLALDPTAEVRVANGLWARQGLTLLPPFLDAARTFFDAEVRSLDFADPGAPGAINEWVRDRTAGRIPKLLETIASEEVLFLVNAIYFKGRWRVPFDRARTRDLPFTGADGRARPVPMMHLGPGPVRYAATSTYQAADLLYGNGAFAMTVLLPVPGETPATVLAGLDPAAWRSLSDRFQETTLALGIPRFRLEHSQRLNDALTTLGMGVAFDAAGADLSGIADVAPERLYLTRVEQKAFVEVNEEGTEAAAATSVGVGVTSLPPSLIVDRPFLFAIRERFSGTILFLGVVLRLG